MKRQEMKYRFYLWDYLWWAGERLHDYPNWRKAVMKHYATRTFSPAKGYFLFFMPVMFFIGVVITICSLIE